MTRQVKATAPGFYEKLREVGEVFFYPEPLPLGSWMEPVDDAGDGAEALPLAAGLAALDQDSDADWTKAGLPDLNRLKEMIGRPVSRAEVEETAPGLARKFASSASGGNAGVADGSPDGDGAEA